MWRLWNGVINATTEELKAASAFCELWAWRSGTLVVAGLLAEVAIAYIRPEYNSFWEHWGSVVADAFVAIGVALEILFGRIGHKCDIEVQVRTEKMLTDATDRAREANDKATFAGLSAGNAIREAALANERAEELRADNISLQAGIRPRRFSFAGWTNDAKRALQVYDPLKEHAGTIALIQVVPDFESQMFGNDIATVLLRAGWRPQIVTANQSNMSDLSFPEGVMIFTLSDGKSQTQAGTTLWMAMLRASHEMDGAAHGDAPIHEILNEPKPGYPLFDPPITAVFIRVGTRRLSSHFWEIQRREIIRQDKEWDEKVANIVRSGRSLRAQATDGTMVDTKIGPDGKLVSADPEKTLYERDRNLTLIVGGMMIRSTPLPEMPDSRQSPASR